MTTSSKHPFADFLNEEMKKRGWANRDLSSTARVSFRAISDARSGALEETLRAGTMASRKRQGVEASTYRILQGLGVDPDPWMANLGLETPKFVMTEGTKFEDRLRLILQEPITEEDVQLFGRLQKDLGELFSIEMACRVLMRKHLEFPKRS